MKYNIGDKVIVRPDLRVGMSPVVREMLIYKGLIVTISNIDGYGEIRIIEDCGAWCWCENNFIPIFIDNKPILCVSCGNAKKFTQIQREKIAQGKIVLCSLCRKKV